MNGRVWWSDPDPSMLREEGKSTADGASSGIGGLTRARVLPSYVALTGQLFLSSDWLPDLANDRIEIMKRCMTYHKGISRPVDAFDKEIPSIWLATDTHTNIRRDVIGLFNWDDKSTQTISCSLSRAGLDEKASYYAFDFWAKTPLPMFKDSIGESNPITCFCNVLTKSPIEYQQVLKSKLSIIDFSEWAHRCFTKCRDL